MKHATIRAAMWLLHTTGLYRRWQLFWRWLERRNHPDWPAVPPARSVDELGRRMEALKKYWTKDPAWRFWDSWSRPEKLAEAAETGVVPPGGCDCDEFASYCAEALKELEQQGVVNCVSLLQLIWENDDGLQGHHLCTFFEVNQETRARRVCYIGNWGLIRGLEDGKTFPIKAEVVDAWVCHSTRDLSVWVRVCPDPKQT